MIKKSKKEKKLYARTIVSTVVILVRKHQHFIDLNAIEGSKLINKQINIQQNRSNKIRKTGI